MIVYAGIRLDKVNGSKVTNIEYNECTHIFFIKTTPPHMDDINIIIHKKYKTFRSVGRRKY